jgi:hypothetical protein
MQAVSHWGSLPDSLKVLLRPVLQQQQSDLQHMPIDVKAALKRHWGEQLPAIWSSLVAAAGLVLPAPVKAADAAAAGPGVSDSPSSPLEMDQAMLQYGEPSQRFQVAHTATLQLDGMGFVQGVTGVLSLDQVGTPG